MRMVNVGRIEVEGLIIFFVLCILALLVMGGVLALVIFAARRAGRQGPTVSTSPPVPSSPPGTAAREILQARYALGEISREQYLSMLDDLEKH